MPNGFPRCFGILVASPAKFSSKPLSGDGTDPRECPAGELGAVIGLHGFIGLKMGISQVADLRVISSNYIASLSKIV